MMIMGHYNMVSATSVIIININLHGKWKIQLKYDCLSLWHLPERSQCWWSSADDFNVFSSKISNFLAKILSKYLIFTINFLWNLVFCVLQIFKKKKNPTVCFQQTLPPLLGLGLHYGAFPLSSYKTMSTYSYMFPVVVAVMFLAALFLLCFNV